MRLRGVVKVPQRLENETAYEKSPQPMLRRTKGRMPRRYIDWNPDLPPAAFPTLEQPRTPQKVDDQISIQDRAINPDDEGGHVTLIRDDGIRNDSGKTKMTGASSSALISDSLQSSVASSGNLNPIYEKNMVTKTNAGEESASGNQDMDDSDPKYTIADTPRLGTPEEAISIPDPEWNELSPRIQVEIFDNLLQDYNSSIISEILGLTDTEREKIQVHMAQRETQMNMEDSQLRRMREEQLKSLLKIDNSDLKHSRTPHRLVFRRTSRKYGRKLGEALEFDFFSCHVGEIVNAQRFLDKRGLNVSYAGEWRDGMSIWGENKDDKAIAIDQAASPSPSINAPASGISHDYSSPFSSKRQGSDIKYPGRPKDLFMRQGDPNLLSEQLIASCRENMRDSHREALHGSDMEAPKHRATLLRDSEYSCIEPLKLVKILPPIIRWHYSEPPLRCSIPDRPSNPAFRHSSTPVTISSTRLRQKLENVRAEAQEERSKAELEESKARKGVEDVSADDWSFQCPLPVGQAILADDCSQMTSPGRIMREKSPEAAHADSLFPLEDANEVQAMPSEVEDGIPSANYKVRATPRDGSEYSRPPSPSPSSLGCNGHVLSITSCVESSPDGECAGDNGESDMDDGDDGDEDEMVLVPIGSRRATN